MRKKTNSAMIQFPDEPALIPYFTAGYPSVNSFSSTLRALEEGGADIVELGLPFSEPIADGPTIQKAVAEALSNGMTPDIFFDELKEIDTDISLVVMTYYNIIFQRGIEKFARNCVKAGINGIIVPDLPVEEARELKNVCESFDLDLVFIVSPVTTKKRFNKIKRQCSGFLYVQARLGTTGVRENISEATFDSLRRFKTNIPKAVGFGISKREHAKKVVQGGADGIVAGSVFIDLMDPNLDEKSWIEKVEKKATELKQGALEGK